MTEQGESIRIEQSRNLEPEGFVEGQVALQARLLVVAATGDKTYLNPQNTEIPPLTPEAFGTESEVDGTFLQHASDVERAHYWETTRSTVEQSRRREVWAEETIAAFNAAEFFATEKGQQWSAFFEKLNIHTGEFTNEHARALYDKYFSPTKSKDNINQFVQDVYNVHATPEEFRQNRDAIQWLAGLFGDKSAQVMTQLADAGTKLPQEITDAVNQDDRRNELNDTEYDLLDFVYNPEVSLNRTAPAHTERIRQQIVTAPLQAMPTITAETTTLVPIRIQSATSEPLVPAGTIAPATTSAESGVRLPTNVAEQNRAREAAYVQTFINQYKVRHQGEPSASVDPVWAGQENLQINGKVVNTCGVASLSNGVHYLERATPAYDPSIDSEQQLVRTLDLGQQANWDRYVHEAGLLGDSALLQIITHLNQRNSPSRYTLKNTDVTMEAMLTGLENGAVVLRDTGAHMVLIPNIEIQNDVVGVRVINPLARNSQPHFMSLEDFARQSGRNLILSKQTQTVHVSNDALQGAAPEISQRPSSDTIRTHFKLLPKQWEAFSDTDREQLSTFYDEFIIAQSLRSGEYTNGITDESRQTYKEKLVSLREHYLSLPPAIQKVVLPVLRRDVGLENVSNAETKKLLKHLSAQAVPNYLGEIRAEALEAFPELQKKTPTPKSEGVAAVTTQESAPALPPAPVIEEDVVEKTWDEMLPSLGLGNLSQEQKAPVLALLQEMEAVEKIGLHAVDAERMQHYEQLLGELRAHYQKIHDTTIRDAVLLILKHRLAPVRSDVVDRHMEQMGVAAEDINSRILQMRKMARSDFPELFPPRERPASVVPEIVSAQPAVVEEVATPAAEAPVVPAASSLPEKAPAEVIDGEVLQAEAQSVEAAPEPSNGAEQPEGMNAEEFKQLIAALKDSSKNEALIPRLEKLFHAIPGVQIDTAFLSKELSSFSLRTEKLSLQMLPKKRLQATITYPATAQDPVKVSFLRSVPNSKETFQIEFTLSEESVIGGGDIKITTIVGKQPKVKAVTFDAEGNASVEGIGEIGQLNIPGILYVITDPKRTKQSLPFESLISA